MTKKMVKKYRNKIWNQKMEIKYRNKMWDQKMAKNVG